MMNIIANETASHMMHMDISTAHTYVHEQIVTEQRHTKRLISFRRTGYFISLLLGESTDISVVRWMTTMGSSERYFIHT